MRTSFVPVALVAVAALGCGGGREAPSDRRVPLAAAQSTAEGPFRAEDLFNWAETRYPQLFPGHQQTQTYQQYQYRFYPDTGNYVGVSGRTVSVLGNLTGGQLVDVGTLGGFECVVVPAACPDYVAPRLSIALGPIVGQRSDRTWIAFGDESKIAKDRALFGASGTLELGVEAKQIVLGRDLAVLVTPGGVAYGWGYSGWAFGASLNAPISFQNRKQIAFPGSVRQAGTASDASAWRTYALLDDGTIWTFPGTGTGTSNPLPLRVNGPDDLSFLSDAQFALLGGSSSVHGVTRAGVVWRIPLGAKEGPRQLPIDRVKQIYCHRFAGGFCVASREDGRAVAWLVPGGLPAAANTSLKIDQPLVVPGVSDVVSAAANSRTVYLLTGSGAVWEWDHDYSYGTDSQGNRKEYLKDPERLSISNATDLACGEAGCFVRRSDGTLLQILSSGATTSAGLPRLP